MKHAAYIAFYAITPTKPKAGASLRAVAAAAQKTAIGGIGISVRTDGDICGSCLDYSCEMCRAYDQERADRNRIAREVAAEFALPFVRAGFFFAWRRPALLHVCRGAATGSDVALANRVRDALAERFAALGYKVYCEDDCGGVEALAQENAG